MVFALPASAHMFHVCLQTKTLPHHRLRRALPGATFRGLWAPLSPFRPYAYGSTRSTAMALRLGCASFVLFLVEAVVAQQTLSAIAVMVAVVVWGRPIFVSGWTAWIMRNWKRPTPARSLCLFVVGMASMRDSGMSSLAHNQISWLVAVACHWQAYWVQSVQLLRHRSQNSPKAGQYASHDCTDAPCCWPQLAHRAGSRSQGAPVPHHLTCPQSQGVHAFRL